MKLLDLLKNVNYEAKNFSDVDIDCIEVDSRKVTKNCLYICMKGFTVNSHDFIASAIENGAKAIVIEMELEELQNYDKIKNDILENNIAVIKVENSRLATSYIACNFFGNPEKSMNLYAVTGTNGKTSSVYFIENILINSGKSTGIITTVETRINGEAIDIPFATSTTPDPIDLMRILSIMKSKGVTDVAMEVSSHALELFKVSSLNFKVASFTNLTRDHLDLHLNMENYKNAKIKLFAQCENAIINVDDEFSDDFVQKAKNNAKKIITYAIVNNADLKPCDISYSNVGISFKLAYEGETVLFEVPIPGKFTVYNILGVIGTALSIGISMKEIASSLKNLSPVTGRIQNVSNNEDYSVIVDYAHTPDGLENIINAVRDFTTGRVITIFGCGGDRDRTKRPIMGEIAGKLSDFSIVTSDNPRTENPEFIVDEVTQGVLKAECEYIKIVDRKEAINYGIDMLKKGDSLIIAGKGHEDYQIFATETIHFDDAEIAREFLSRKQEV